MLGRWSNEPTGERCNEFGQFLLALGFHHVVLNPKFSAPLHVRVTIRARKDDDGDRLEVRMMSNQFEEPDPVELGEIQIEDYQSGSWRILERSRPSEEEHGIQGAPDAVEITCETALGESV